MLTEMQISAEVFPTKSQVHLLAGISRRGRQARLHRRAGLPHVRHARLLAPRRLREGVPLARRRATRVGSSLSAPEIPIYIPSPTWPERPNWINVALCRFTVWMAARRDNHKGVGAQPRRRVGPQPHARGPRARQGGAQAHGARRGEVLAGVHARQPGAVNDAATGTRRVSRGLVSSSSVAHGVLENGTALGYWFVTPVVWMIPLDNSG